MKIELLQSKIHRATVTDANLNYKGSITIDEELLEASGIIEHQKVDIVNINNGERFSTYVIKGTKGNGDICINGGASRLVQRGDLVIIISYGLFKQKEALKHEPTVVMVDEKNTIID